MSRIGLTVRFDSELMTAPMYDGDEYRQLMTITRERSVHTNIDLDGGSYMYDEVQTDVTGDTWIPVSSIRYSED